MENTAVDAVIIGVNVFIFIIALTFSIMLMSTVLDMSNAVSARAVTTTNSALLQSIGYINEKKISGQEVYQYYLKYVINKEGNLDADKYLLKINLDGLRTEELNIFKKEYLDYEFCVIYSGKEDIFEEGIRTEKNIYVFSKDS